MYQYRPQAPIFWIAVVGLLGWMGIAMIHAARLESATYDEPTYLAAGYDHLTNGSYWFNYEHPPLAKLLAALPLLEMDLRAPLEYDAYRNGHPRDGAVPFLYGNRERPAGILFRSRLVFTGLALAFGLILALWTRRRFGALAGGLALAFFSLDPNMVAHGHYAATDLIATIFVFLTCIAWDHYMRIRKWWPLLLTGVLLGLVITSKFSALILLVILPLLYILRGIVARRQSFARLGPAMYVAVLLAGGIVALTYFEETRRSLGEYAPRLDKFVDRSLISGRVFAWAGERLSIPGHIYLLGITTLEDHNRRGHSAYLMGESSLEGWWYYFPLVFLWKTPTAILLGLGALVVLAAMRLAREGVGKLRRLDFLWWLLAFVPVLIMAVSMTASINIGHRHLLPLYPFLAVLVAAGLVRLRARCLGLALAGLLAVEHAWIAPDYLAYFSPVAGGPDQAPRYLVDSNIDWGQDFLKLKSYLSPEERSNAFLAYFGVSDRLYHGSRLRLVPGTKDSEGRLHSRRERNVSFLARRRSDIRMAPREGTGSEERPYHLRL